MTTLALRDGLHFPGAATFVCRACRRGYCDPMPGASGGCVGGRCTCEHDGDGPPPEPPRAPVTVRGERVYLKGQRHPADVTRASHLEGPQLSRATVNRAERDLRARCAPGVKARPEPERRAVVERAVLVGPKAAAEAAGVSENTVRRWAQDLCVSFPPRRSDTYPQDVMATAVDAAHRLGSAKVASAELGIPSSNIIKWARRLNRPLAGKPGPPRKDRPMPRPISPTDVEPDEDIPLSKETAPCCVAAVDSDGRPPIGYCSPSCLRRPKP